MRLKHHCECDVRSLPAAGKDILPFIKNCFQEYSPIRGSPQLKSGAIYCYQDKRWPLMI